jgi:hypothetical protein
LIHEKLLNPLKCLIIRNILVLLDFFLILGFIIGTGIIFLRNTFSTIDWVPESSIVLIALRGFLLHILRNFIYVKAFLESYVQAALYQYCVKLFIFSIVDLTISNQIKGIFLYAKIIYVLRFLKKFICSLMNMLNIYLSVRNLSN